MSTAETEIEYTAPAAGREIGTVFRHEFRHLALSWRTLLPMIVYAGCGALAVLSFIYAADRAREAALEKLGGEALAKFEEESWHHAGEALKGLGIDLSSDLDAMQEAHVPPLVVFFQFVASLFLPLLVALVTFDQFSELSTRGARFALLRVRRGTYFVGKSLAAIASVAVFLLVMWVIVGGVAAYRAMDGHAVDALREAVRSWSLSCVLALPYLSLTAVVSATARPGMAFLGTLGLWIMLFVGDMVTGLLAQGESARATFFGVVEKIFPAEHGAKLLARSPETLWTSIGGLVVIAAFGYALASFIVRRRDV